MGLGCLEEGVVAKESAICRECGQVFPRDEGWQRLCLVCWKTERGYNMTKADDAFAWLQGEYERLLQEKKLLEENLGREEAKKKEPDHEAELDELLSGDLLPHLINLCHPDRHRGSAKATKVTQLLLGYRDRKRARRRKKR